MGNTSYQTIEISRHRRTTELPNKEEILDWNLPDYDTLRLSKIRINQPVLKPLGGNNLYIKRMQGFVQTQVCN